MNDDGMTEHQQLGNKWDIDGKYSELDGDDYSFQVTFETAWSPPEQIYYVLRESTQQLTCGSMTNQAQVAVIWEHNGISNEDLMETSKRPVNWHCSRLSPETHDL